MPRPSGCQIPHLVGENPDRIDGNHSLTIKDGLAAPQAGCRAGAPKTNRAGRITARPGFAKCGSRSGVKHGDDLEGSRIYHHDLVADEEKLIASPIRIVRHDFGRQWMEADVARNAGTD